mmetsp:Transcript_7555/g.18734  ORF Transcript_7555/g.18734 Transcript_7555/m.18734 type:complete len:371 (-) Transcript_7555:1321-2433(-)
MADPTTHVPPTMQALTFAGKQAIELSTVPTPKVIHPTDVLVKVHLAGICGSDLHPFHEREKGIAKGCVTGHEFVGTIVAAGSRVSKLAVGDRVMCPFTANCGECTFCARGFTCRCSHTQARLFGWVSDAELGLPAEARVGLQGAQAEYVRVPLADSTLAKIPEGVSDEEGVLLGDILSTAFFCAENGGVGPGCEVAVVGCGPVGLLAIMAAQHLGASKVWAVDGIPARLAMASSLGAHALDFTQCDPAAAIREATGGLGVDVALEVVGAQSALRVAFDALRPTGTLSSVGVHTYESFPWTPVEVYDKNLTFRAGRCPARRYMEKLAPVVAQKTRDWARIITHRLPLSEGVRGYELFDKKLDGCIKVVLQC